MSYVKVSFIIPAYNVGQYIKKTLESCLNQTSDDYEIIIVNDGSTDNTSDIARRILGERKFKRYCIVEQENKGETAARNRGMKEARGEYLLFLDGDDYVSPDLVETVTRIVENSPVDIVCWKYAVVNEYGRFLKNVIPFSGVPSNRPVKGLDILYRILVARTFWIYSGSAAYRRSFIFNHDLWFTDGCYCGGDQEFFYKALFWSDSVWFIDKVFLYYVRRKGSITQGYNIRRFDSIIAFERVLSYFDENQQNSRNDERLRQIKNAVYENRQIYFILNFIHFTRQMNFIEITTELNNLRHSMEDVYPGLYQRIMHDISSTKRLSVQLSPLKKAGFRLFQVSPKFFLQICAILHRIGFLEKIGFY